MPFNLKGKRKYVQGPDIYDSMLEVSREYFGKYPSTVYGTFHNLLKNCAVISIYNKIDKLNQDKVLSNFLVSIERKQYYIIFSNSRFKIFSNRKYHENDVIKSSFIVKNEINMVVKSNFSYMEQIVALNKKLHFEIYPEAQGKWLFTKIQLEKIIKPKLFIDNLLKIEAEKNFHYKLTKNLIYLDDVYIGQIWFSLI
jgi:hypothetical protein